MLISCSSGESGGFTGVCCCRAYSLSRAASSSRIKVRMATVPTAVIACVTMDDVASQFCRHTGFFKRFDMNKLPLTRDQKSIVELITQRSPGRSISTFVWEVPTSILEVSYSNTIDYFSANLESGIVVVFKACPDGSAEADMRVVFGKKSIPKKVASGS